MHLPCAAPFMFFRENKKSEVGNDLLSHAVPRAVPSALVGLTAGFGMGPGVPPPRKSPTSLFKSREDYSVVKTYQVSMNAEQRSCVNATRKPSRVSTGRLHGLPRFHHRPIELVVSQRAYPLEGGGWPHLGASFPLRCFQRFSLPDVATQLCPWRDNWYTRGRSTPVLSY